MKTNIWQLLLGLVAASTLVVVVALLAESWTLRRWAEEERSKILDRSDPALEAHRAEQRAIFEEYAWIDREQESVRLPIERAMELVLQESQGGLK